MAFYRHKFKVAPNPGLAGSFPIDMLRYDHAIPASEEDARLIQANIEHLATVKEVTLMRFDTNPRWRPTDGRWQSFTWFVVGTVTSDKMP